MPGIWNGISGIYRRGDQVSIYTDWQSVQNAQGVCMAVDGDLGYVVNVTVYGAGNHVLTRDCG